MTCPEADETRARAAIIGRKGGLASSSHLSPAERSARASKAAKARWSKEDAKRLADGREPTKSWSSQLEGEDLAAWLEVLDDTMPEAQTWPHEARRRQALLLLKTSIADAAVDALRRGGL